MRIPVLLALLTPVLAGLDIQDGRTLELPAGRWQEPVTVGLKGANLTAAAPCELAAAVTLATRGPGGVDATFIARSLRGMRIDDWRGSQPVAGRRHSATIDQHNQAFGTPEERRAWGIRGNDGDWDNFSVQWDAFLAVPVDGAELATASDDGSRVWLDRNGDGTVQPDEWGSNAWGQGQGTTQRTVHADLKAGTWRIRVQYEDGGGGNACTLRWRLPGKPWVTVPSEGFQAAGWLHMSGPVTIAAPVVGQGHLRLGDGVRLAVVPRTAGVEITGAVALAADMNLDGVDLRFAGGSLDLAGRTLHLGSITGEGSIRLGGGVLELPGGESRLSILGAGTVRLAGDARVLSLGPEARVEGGSLRSTDRCVVRAAMAAPLTTVIPLYDQTTGGRALEVGLDLAPGLSGTVGIGAWRADRQGRWFQRILPGSFGAGYHRLRIDLGDDDTLRPEGHRGVWSPDAAADAGRIGLFLYATGACGSAITLDTTLAAPDPRPAAPPILGDLRCDPSSAATGRRWSASVRPEPFPEDATDPEVFTLALVATGPDGQERRYAGFVDEPVVAIDRGDREEFRTAGAPRFQVRFRPTLPGRYRMRLEAAWHGSATAAADLPDLVASGPAWDGIARVDAKDPRFFSAGGAMVWPAGCNLNSTYDVRSHSNLQTVLTPDRGSFTRMAYLERLAAGGATGCEIWLSPWNLGLEWDPAWSGFRGAGRYHAGHAWALDRFLDRAEELGILVNVSLFNHGMARAGSGAEEDWENHPYSQYLGGWLSAPEGLFTDGRAFAYQRRLFRYLAARYGDSPAVLGWKLWAEMNLAQAQRDLVLAWHERAAAAFAEVDPWRHPVTTHWCGDWNSVERGIATLPGLGFITIDAYKGEDRDVASLLCQSTRDPRRPGGGLADLGKPILVTEFGGSAGATSRTRMAAEHAIGPWVGMVSGHGGSPMLWWFEWIDQEDRFGVYGAINRFLAFEDLRGADAGCVAPYPAGDGSLWCRAWSRPGRALGYLLDNAWGVTGAARPIEGASIRMPGDVRSGPMRIEWWDADRGVVIDRRDFSHPGGTLDLKAPPFRRHLGFKLIRTG